MQFTLTTEVGEGGSIEPTELLVDSGATGVFTLTADEGYVIDSVSGCDGALEEDQYETGAIAGDCIVSASFKIADAGADAEAPVASILFPWKVSRTEEGSVLVKGVASDKNGITSIKVNGVEANILPLSSEVSPLEVHRSAPAAFTSYSGMESEVTESEVMEEDSTAEAESEVTWEVTLPLEDADSTLLVVSTEDDQGNVEESASVAEVISRKVPTRFVVDATNRRLLGQASLDQLIAFGLDDASYSPLSVSGLGYCDGLAYRASSNSVLCGQLSDNWVRLTSVDMASGGKTQLKFQNLNLDTDKWLYAHLYGAQLTADEASLYLLFKYFSVDGYDFSKTVVQRYDFVGDSITTVIDGETADGQVIKSDSFALAADGLLLFSDYWGNENADGVRKVSLDGATATDLLPVSDLLLAGIAVNAANTTAYLAGYEGIVKGDLASGEITTLSLESEEALYNIAQVRSVGLDEANSRILVADSSFEYVMAIDTESGARSEFAGNGVGSGKRMVAPRGVALDETANKAYLLDDGGNAAEYLIEVDLESGDRTVVTGFDFECNHTAQDLLLDSANNRLYAVFPNAIFSINPTDGSWSKLVDGTPSGYDCGSGIFSFVGATLDTVNKQLLVTDTELNGVWSVDLATGALDALVQSEELFDVPVDVELDAEKGLLYILTQAADGLYSYDMATGETTGLLQNCTTAPINNALNPEFEAVRSLKLDPERGSMWVAGGVMAKVDMNADACAAEVKHNAPVFNMVLTSKQQLLGTTFNQLMQLDFESGKHVIISK
ncbi:hypothetical protein [Microbulbifer sp. ALW1]|uniref:hypothetical protein n=1 Tax=Microbulbifer sp. (strain ALW1) TaxID=1516059 RepID=UPI001911CAA7|nr:hypothetical protein [Microbulbifer sp. ALW1]